MHRIFQNFVDRLSSASDTNALRDAMAKAAAALDLSCFAYLSISSRSGAAPRLMSTYPSAWTKQYLQSHYERVDPVIIQALSHPEPFEWGLGIGSIALSGPQRQMFEEAAKFGLRYGFTIPVHDGRGPIAAMTFATDERGSQFERSINVHARVLQLMAVYFHAHARRKLASDRVVVGVSLSPREFECLEWAAQGKSAWEIGHTVTDARMERILRRAEWPLQRIGSPRKLGNTLAVAGYLNVSAESLMRVRAAGGLQGPVLWEPVALAAA
jgi:LuxR family transcriptional regulator, activator of conjugal transfer of Ti plasmids